MFNVDTMRQQLHEGADIKQLVWDALRQTPISNGQLDPNGSCNANCWYCPVKYEGNPIDGVNHLDPEDLDAVLASIRGSTVVQGFDHLYTAHYNEVLLYKHFTTMLSLFRTHRFRTMILSNGTPLTPSRTDLLLANTDIVTDIALNIPSFDPTDWSTKAGFNERMHGALMRNLDYLHTVMTIPVNVLVNCVTEYFAGDILTKGILTPRKQADEIIGKFKSRFPKFEVTLVDALVDRAGWLADRNVLKNQRAVMPAGQRVFACDHDLARGSRLYGWLHVNAFGEVFTCCDDFKMEYKFGDLTKQSLDSVWFSERHVDAIVKSMNKMCVTCAHHITA